jgi:hypothetical protein
MSHKCSRCASYTPQRMSLQNHREAGEMFRTILLDGILAKRAFNRMFDVYFALQFQLEKEYTMKELPNNICFLVYSLQIQPRWYGRDVLGALKKLREIVVASYPPSPFLRGIAKKIDQTIKELEA